MITLNKEEFLKAIKAVKSAVAKSKLQPVLETINLKTENGGLILTCTDCTNVARAVIEVNAQENINICINAEKLEAIVSRLDDIINIEIEDATAIIKSGKTIFKCLYIQGNEFPEIKIELEGEKIILAKDDFLRGVNKTCFATAQDNLSSIISGVCFAFNDKSYEMAATDGNRLTRVVFDTAFQGEGRYVIPKTALTSVAKIIKDDLQIFCKDNNIVFYTDNFVYSTKLLNGAYPPYIQLFPTTFSQIITIDKNELLESLDKVSIMINDRTNTTKCIFAENKLSLITDCSEGDAKDDIDIDYIGKDITICFNYRYLVEGLRAMDSEVITININSSSSAVLFIGDYSYLVMPIHLKNQE